MKKLRRVAAAALLLATLAGGIMMVGCGPTRSYWGIESEYNFNGDGPRKHHGHKKPKPPKHKKHHKHHHDWDD